MECTYRISTPSSLITPATALQVLSMISSQEYSDSTDLYAGHDSDVRSSGIQVRGSDIFNGPPKGKLGLASQASRFLNKTQGLLGNTGGGNDRKGKHNPKQAQANLRTRPFLMVKLFALQKILFRFRSCLESDCYKEYRNDILLSEQYYNNDNAEDQDHRTVIDDVDEADLQTAKRDIALAMLQNCLDEYLSCASNIPSLSSSTRDV
jgi:hypothetical protein